MNTIHLPTEITCSTESLLMFNFKPLFIDHLPTLKQLQILCKLNNSQWQSGKACRGSRGDLKLSLLQQQWARETEDSEIFQSCLETRTSPVNVPVRSTKREDITASWCEKGKGYINSSHKCYLISLRKRLTQKNGENETRW
jgi:hypothetical protein